MDEGYIKVTMNLPEELVRKIKAQAVINGCSRTDLVVRYLNNEFWLNDREANGEVVLVYDGDTYRQVLRNTH